MHYRDLDNYRGLDNRIRRAVAMLLIYSCMCQAYADDKSLDTQRTVTMAVNFAIPPYVMVEQDAGIELDILRQAFRQSGYQSVIKRLPFSQTLASFHKGHVDGVININPKLAELYGSGFVSDPVIVFQDGVITVSQAGYTFRKIADLQDRKVLGYATAATAFGAAFLGMTKANAGYRETNYQLVQVLELMSGVVEAVIADRHIFEYHRRECVASSNSEDDFSKLLKRYDPLLTSRFQRQTLDCSQTVQFHDILPEISYHFIFRDEQIRNSFNQGLKVIRQSGEYDRIKSRYLEVLHNPASVEGSR